MPDQSAIEPETAPNNLAMHGSAADERQSLLNLAPDMPPAGAADRGLARRQKRDGLRADSRRTSEYLASRGGGTVVEVFHDVVKLGVVRGVRMLMAELGMTRDAAIAQWNLMATTLLPYTAHRLDPIDASSAGAAGAAGGMAALHFLAARAAGDRILAGHASGESPIRQIGDSQNSEDLTRFPDGGTVMNRRQPMVVLPPVGKD